MNLDTDLIAKMPVRWRLKVLPKRFCAEPCAKTAVCLFCAGAFAVRVAGRARDGDRPA